MEEPSIVRYTWGGVPLDGARALMIQALVDDSRIASLSMLSEPDGRYERLLVVIQLTPGRCNAQPWRPTAVSIVTRTDILVSPLGEVPTRTLDSGAFVQGMRIAQVH